MRFEEYAEELSFRSADGKTDIRPHVWCSDEASALPVRGIVQIAHGMVEHIGRYDDFARFLACNGFAVCGADWIGHGANAASSEMVGVLPSNAHECFIQDFHTLRRSVQDRFGKDIPFFVLGHSMGSFVVRVYVSRYGQGLSGAVISGTAQQASLTSLSGHALAKALGKAKGEDYRSVFLDGMGVGAYGKKVPDAKTPLDWLNTDDSEVAAYQADPYCGAMFSVGGYAALTSLTKTMSSPSCVRRIPVSLPVLFIAGDQDPVGDFGKGVKAAARQMSKAGVESVSVRLYDGMRHEVLNHPGKKAVYRDVLDWLNARA